MSGRILVVVLLLAILTTAVTYFCAADTAEVQSDAGLSDLERRSNVHGWPWGFYAEVTELVRYTDERVAVMEYSQFRFEQFMQTFLLWFVAWVILVPLLLLLAGARPRRS